MHLKTYLRKYDTDVTNKTLTYANFVTILMTCDYVYHFRAQIMMKKAWKTKQ